MDVYFEAFFQWVFCKFLSNLLRKTRNVLERGLLKPGVTAASWGVHTPVAAESHCLGQEGAILMGWRKSEKLGFILWMEEIPHQLVDGLSRCNPILYSVSWLPNGYQLLLDFFHHSRMSRKLDARLRWFVDWLRKRLIGFMGPKASFPVVSLGVRILSPNKSFCGFPWSFW